MHVSWQTPQEVDAGMRAMLSSRLSPTTCIFRNIYEIWGDPQEFQEYLSQFSTPEQKLAACQGLPWYTHGWCEAHQDWCPYTQSRFRCQGAPCVDWSMAGLGRGLHGPMFPTMIAAGSKSRLTQTHAVTIENVPQLPAEVVQVCFGPDYEWQGVVQAPSDVGYHFISRDRTLHSTPNDRHPCNCTDCLSKPYTASCRPQEVHGRDQSQVLHMGS